MQDRKWANRSRNHESRPRRPRAETDAAEIVAQSEGRLVLAMENCPHQFVLCGKEADIEEDLKSVAKPEKRERLTRKLATIQHRIEQAEWLLGQI